MKNAIGPLAGCDKEESEDSANDDDAASEKKISSPWVTTLGRLNFPFRSKEERKDESLALLQI